MDNQYIVVDEFNIKNAKVIVLNEQPAIIDIKHSRIVIDNTIIPYGLTHNEKWLTVNSNKQFKGKKITFTN